MAITPLYTPNLIDGPAFHLRYAWTGWPAVGEHFPSRPSDDLFVGLAKQWVTDGIRLLESVWSTDHIQFTCSVTPKINPVLFASRIKGRLQYALRSELVPVSFSRKVAFRSIGDNSRGDVERYIANQVTKERYADSRFSTMLSQFTIRNPHVRLEEPTKTNSGRYWYNLHLVVVTDSRTRFVDEPSLARLSRLCDAIAKKKQHRVSIRSVMPDHLHLAVGGVVNQSPEEIALSYMNNTSYGFGQKWLWHPSYYVGTFGEYDMGAVRRE